MIFKGVREGKPYPEHGLSTRDWSRIPPRQIRLDELVTTTTVLALDRLLSEDSTFYGDLFPHAVKWQGVIYLEDGLHWPCGPRYAIELCCTPGSSTWISCGWSNRRLIQDRADHAVGQQPSPIGEHQPLVHEPAQPAIHHRRNAAPFFDSQVRQRDSGVEPHRQQHLLGVPLYRAEDLVATDRQPPFPSCLA